jgi:hypothetical protein
MGVAENKETVRLELELWNQHDWRRHDVLHADDIVFHGGPRIYRFGSEGKIVEAWGLIDELSFLRQLELAPATT